MADEKQEKPYDRDEGMAIVAWTVTLAYASLFIGGAVLHLLDKRKGRGR